MVCRGNCWSLTSWHVTYTTACLSADVLIKCSQQAYLSEPNAGPHKSGCSTKTLLSPWRLQKCFCCFLLDLIKSRSKNCVCARCTEHVTCETLIFVLIMYNRHYIPHFDINLHICYPKLPLKKVLKYSFVPFSLLRNDPCSSSIDGILSSDGCSTLSSFKVKNFLFSQYFHTN